MKVRSPHLAILFLALAALMLEGCLGLPRGVEDAVTFTLEADFPAAPAAPAGPVLLVMPPRAQPGYDTAAMAYTLSGQELAYFARHRWVDAPHRMLAPLLVRALEAEGAFSAVLHGPAAARARWRLDTEVLRLRQDFSHSPSRLELGLRAQLTDLSAPGFVRAQSFSITLPAAADDPRAGARAAREAVARLLPELARWAAAVTRGAPTP